MRMSILTSTISASCSFYSYIPHYPSTSPSFTISLYIILLHADIYRKINYSVEGTAWYKPADGFVLFPYLTGGVIRYRISASLSVSLSLYLSIYLSIYLSLPPRLILVLTYDLCEWTNVAISIPTPTSLPFPWASTKTHPTYPSHPSHHYMHSFDPPVSLWPSIYSWSGYLPSMSTITASQMLSQTMTLLPLMLGSLPIK